MYEPFTNGQIARMRALFDSQTGIRKDIMTLAEILTNPPYLTGPTHFNTTGTFTVNDMPTGATITSFAYCLPSSTSGNSITLSNTNNSEPAIETISVTVTLGNYTYHTKPVEFIHGAYIPEFVIGYSRMGSSETDGWCVSGGSGCFLRVEGLNSEELQLLQNMQYQARILNSNGTVHYTLPNTFSFTWNQDYDTGCSGAYPYYILEMRNVTYNSNSAWHQINDLIYGTSCNSLLRFTAFPNPVSDVLNIGFDQATLQQQSQWQQSQLTTETFDIRLYDSNGMLQQQTSYQGQGTIQLSTSSLPNGIYFLRIYSSLTPSQPEVHRIIINH
jgi:hypothetical protein